MSKATSFLAVCALFSLMACSVHTAAPDHHHHHHHHKKEKRIPPGQAKKMHGDKSARKYAPGHNK